MEEKTIYTPKQLTDDERLTDDDVETIRIHLNAFKENLCNQHRWKEAEEYEQLIDRFLAFTSTHGWTPCSEALPKAGVRYQVTFESGEVGYADFRNKIFLSDGSVKENVWEIERYYEDDGEVIAWQPLPEPYKEPKK